MLELHSPVKAGQPQRSAQLLFVIQMQLVVPFNLLPEVHPGQEVPIMTAEVWQEQAWGLVSAAAAGVGCAMV